MQSRAMRVEEFERLLKQELSSLKYQNEPKNHQKGKMPLKKKKQRKKKPRKSHQPSKKQTTYAYINRHGINGAPGKPRPPRFKTQKMPRKSAPEPAEHTSMNQLKRVNRSGFFDRRVISGSRTPDPNPRLRDNTYNGSGSTNHINPYQDEASKCDGLRHQSIKSFGMRNKSISLPRGYRNGNGAGRRRVAKFEEELRFRPKLSKKSLMLASYMENPMERLTKRKSKKRSKALRDMDKDLTFTPQINRKSSKLDRKRAKSKKNRHEQLHNLAQSYINKREQRRREKDMKINDEDLECVFQPELVTNYTPEYVNELSFVERSYLWRQRRDQKIEIARNRKSLSSNEIPLKSGAASRSIRGEAKPPRAPNGHRSRMVRDMTDDQHYDLRVRSIKKSIERIIA